MHSDSGFPDEFKDILKNHFNIDKRKILLDKQIATYQDYKIMHEKKITEEIENEFKKLKEQNQNNEKLEDIALDILCLYPENEEKKEIRKYIETIIIPKRTDKELKSNPIEYSGLAEVVYNRKNKFIIKYINTETLNYIVFINYIIEKICDKIEKAGDFKNIKDNFYGIKKINDLEKFLIKLIKFIWDTHNTDYPIKSCIDSKTSEKKVFLNIQNQLSSISQIQMKLSFECKEKEKIILDLCLNKHINKDFRSKLLNENLNNSLYNYQNKFSTIDFPSICRKIDDVIMEYDQKKENQGKTYDEDFFNLCKTVKNLKLEKDLMKGLFPYFWRNKSKIIISCVDEEEIEPFIDIICEGGFDKLLSNLSNIDESNKKDKNENIFTKLFKKKDDKKNNPHSDINNDDINHKNIVYKDKLGCIIKQKFNFEIIKLDEKKKENLIYKESLPTKSVEIQFNNDIVYNDICDFKIIIPQNSVTKEINNKDIKIVCKQNKDNSFEFIH